MQLIGITTRYTKINTAINTNAMDPNNNAPSGFMCEPDVIGDERLKVLLQEGHLNLP
jgi:hypothetical protein|tara:strand:- start:576 stop:746 length:171 start_codon:yes stop_codon:yes gene_type:complete